MQVTAALLAAIGTACLFSSTAGAQEDKAPPTPVIRERARIGFGESTKTYYKLGCFSPVEVVIRGGLTTVSGEVSLAAPDGDGIPAEVARNEQVGARSEHAVRLLAPIGRETPTMRVRFAYQDQSGAGGLTSRTVIDRDDLEQSESLTPGQPLYLVVGPAIGLEESIQNQKSRWPEGSAPQIVPLSNTRQLPTRWYGYQAVDLLVLTSSRPEIYQTMSDAQRDALLEWVRMGGRVLISAGSASRPLLIEGGPLHGLVPGKVDAFQDLNRSNGFEEFIEKSSQSVKLSARLFPKADSRMNVPFVKQVDGQVVARDFDLPLIVRSVAGFGEVLFVAGDLDSRLFLDWPDLPQFHVVLLDWPVASTSANDASIAGIRQTDISTQLRAGLDQFEGVRLVPFALVAFLVVLYILLIGPGDYFLVKHFFKGRMEFTWITFPTMVILVSIGSYWLAGRMKGDKLRICQASVIDFDLAAKAADGTSAPLVRGTAWVNVFSPQTQRYNFSLDPTVPAEDAQTAKTSMLLSWLGLPEHALGGMSGNDPGLAASAPAYALELESARMLRTPIQVWSTKAITGRWSQTGVDLAEGTLTGAGDELTAGSVMSHVDLSDCFLAYGNSYYPLGDMKVGLSVTVPLRSRLDLVNRLKKTELVAKEDKFSQSFESTPYNPRSLNVYETLEKMMFFRLIDGRAYTNMQNHFQGFVDLSSHLKAGRAVLVGRSDKPGATLLHDGQPIADDEAKTSTIYRYVFPVTSSASEGQQR